MRHCSGTTRTTFPRNSFVSASPGWRDNLKASCTAGSWKEDGHGRPRPINTCMELSSLSRTAERKATPERRPLNTYCYVCMDVVAFPVLADEPTGQLVDAGVQYLEALVALRERLLQSLYFQLQRIQASHGDAGCWAASPSSHYFRLHSRPRENKRNLNAGRHGRSAQQISLDESDRRTVKNKYLHTPPNRPTKKSQQMAKLHT